MKSFNICIVRPIGYLHSHAFDELAELIRFSLIDLNFDAEIEFNKIDYDKKNIIIGCHLLNINNMKDVPKSSIIINTEQLYNDFLPEHELIYSWAENFEVWDYSDRNIIRFNDRGIKNIKLLRLGFQKELMRLDHSKDKDVDILFYGSMNERRKNILDQLIVKGLTVKILFGIYGKERDAWIERSKLVINHHYYQSQIFEVVRVFYLLTNSVAVVGEVNDTTSIDHIYKEGIHPVQYDGLVEACLKVVKDDKYRYELRDKAITSIAKYPQKAYTQKLL